MYTTLAWFINVYLILFFFKSFHYDQYIVNTENIESLCIVPEWFDEGGQGWYIVSMTFCDDLGSRKKSSSLNGRAIKKGGREAWPLRKKGTFIFQHSKAVKKVLH